jgi:hypothetical protein
MDILELMKKMAFLFKYKDIYENKEDLILG